MKKKTIKIIFNIILTVLLLIQPIKNVQSTPLAPLEIVGLVSDIIGLLGGFDQTVERKLSRIEQTLLNSILGDIEGVLVVLRDSKYYDETLKTEIYKSSLIDLNQSLKKSESLLNSFLKNKRLEESVRLWEVFSKLNMLKKEINRSLNQEVVATLTENNFKRSAKKYRIKIKNVENYHVSKCINTAAISANGSGGAAGIGICGMGEPISCVAGLTVEVVITVGGWIYHKNSEKTKRRCRKEIKSKKEKARLRIASDK